MQKHLQNKTILRMIASSCVVFLLPVIILYFLYTNSVVDAIEDEAQQIIANDLTSSIRLLDAQFESIDDTVKLFQRGSGYQSYLTNGFRYDKEGTSSISSMESDIAYIYLLSDTADDFFVVFPEVDSVFSVSGLHRTSTYLSRFYHRPGQSAYDLSELFSYASAFQVVSSQETTTRTGTGDYITFIYPLPKSSTGQGATAVFCVAADKLCEVFRPRSADFQTSTFVLQGDKLLFSYNASDGQLAEISARSGAIPLGSSDFTVGGEAFVAIRQTSQYNGWTYITLLPHDNSMYRNAFSISHFFRLYIVLTLGAGVLAIGIFLWLNYMPIHNLRKKALSALPAEKPSPEASDGLDAISRALSYLQDRNLALNTTLLRNIREIRLHRLQRLLGDYYPSVEDFNADCEQIGITFHHNRFYVSAVLLPEGAQDPEQVISLLAKEFKGCYEQEMLYQPQQKQVIIMHCIDDGAEIPIERFYAVLGALHDQLNIAATIGIGRIHTGTDTMSKSYMQASAALDYRLVKGSGTVITYDDVMGYYLDRYQYPKQGFVRLENCLQAGNAASATRALDELVDFLTETPLSLMNVRCISFDIVKMLLSAPNVRQSTAHLLPEALMQLSSEKSKANMITVIKNVCAGITIQDAQEDAVSDSRLLEDILVYIQENYCRCDFSIQEVADHFMMLPQNIGQFFKLKTGRGLLEHLIGLRIKRAKELLHTTDMSVKEISLSIGYYNVSSFIRRFKQHEGITPNEYRFKC